MQGVDEQLEELLKQLVSIDSVNPTYGGRGEKELGDFVFDWLQQRGLSPRRQEVAPSRDNVYVRLGPPDAPAILLDGHLDTVGVEGWAAGSPFELRAEGERLFGRGACDTKASLAVFLQLAAYFARRPDELKLGLVVAATVDEEAQQQGAAALMELKESLGMAAALTGEPTQSRIVASHKGVCRYLIETSGVAAHASTPEKGESAIMKMSQALELLRKESHALASAYPPEDMRRGTLNVGRISGGIGFNIVPDHCLVEIDRRIGVEEDLSEAGARLRDLVRQVDGAWVTTILEQPAVATDTDHWFPQSLAAAARAEGAAGRFESAMYMTNAVAYAAAGLAAVVFGPGSSDQAHRVDESIERGEMERSFRILQRMLQQGLSESELERLP